MVMLNCRVLKLEDLLELARNNEADLTAPIQTFSLPGSKIEIGDEPNSMGVVNLSPDSWYPGKRLPQHRGCDFPREIIGSSGCGYCGYGWGIDLA